LDLAQVTQNLGTPNFQKFFESVQGLCVVVLPDNPKFTIVAVSDAYLKQTKKNRQKIIGMGLFQVFPDKPDSQGSNSFKRVIEYGLAHTMAIQRYDIPSSDVEGSSYEERHWKPTNSPIIDSDGKLIYIMHQVEDVTELVKKKCSDKLNSNFHKKDQKTSTILRLVGPFLLGLLALGLQIFFRELVGGNYFLFLFPALLLGSAFCGLGPGLIASLGMTIGAWFYIVPPIDSFSFNKTSDIFGIFIFMLLSIIFSVFGGMARKNRLKTADYQLYLDETNEKLLESNNQLTIQKTELTTLLENVKTAKAKLRGQLESAQDAIVVIGPDGNIQFVNEQVEKWFGYSKVELMGRPIEVLVPQNMTEAHKGYRDSYLKQPINRPMGRPGIGLKGRRKNGSEFPVDIALSHSGSQQEMVITAIIRDMSIKHRQETQMRFLDKAGQLLANSPEHEDTLQKTADLFVSELAVGCVMRIMDDDGSFFVKAISHQNLLKKTELEILLTSMDAKKIVATDVAEAIRTHEVQIRRSKTPVRLELTELDEWEKQEVDYYTKCHTVTIPLLLSGQILGVLSLIQEENSDLFSVNDIIFLQAIGTRMALSVENTNLFKKAQHAVKVREEILAIVTHDLKSPLSSIQLITQMLANTKAEDREKIVTLIGLIQDSTDQMERLITDLMDFSKIQEGNLFINKQMENPNDLIKLIANLIDLKTKEKALQFTTDVSLELSSFAYDKYRILQALYNLVGNAIKFTERNGKILISVKKSVGGVTFSVTDNGKGIARENLTNVFDRYWQGQSTSAFSAGLGLAITKGIIEAHGGKIWLESQLGVGSTFHFELPLS
jgi:PAS domain S-box-containing protein